MNYKRKHICILVILGLLCIYMLFLSAAFFKLSTIIEYFKIKFIQTKLNIFGVKDDNDFFMTQGDVKELITKFNHEEQIANLNIYGGVLTDAPVFVIFVDKYKTSFDFLLGSLWRVQGIRDALLVFSHSYFDNKINAIIKSITFARVIQIYYPYSLQLNPVEFPGYDNINCSCDMTGNLAKYNINYTSTKSTNTQCEEGCRNPLLSQKKHFWWWTVNHVFESLSHTKNHKGVFIFLDNDLFLMEDFIYMTLHMKNISKFLFQSGFVALSTTGKTPDFSETKVDGVDVKDWNPKEHSSVLAFDSDVWKSIAEHYDLFCNFDDYSWSTSLFHLSLHKKNGRFKVISSTMPRAYKTNEFVTVPNKFIEFNIIETISRIVEIQKIHMLYPKELEVFIDLKDDFVTHPVQNNGSWKDPKDIEMCTNITEYTARMDLLGNLTYEYTDENEDMEYDDTINT